MPRTPISSEDRRYGERLAGRISAERTNSGKPAQEIAVTAKMSIDTVRSVESGRVPSPGFHTIARLADALGLSLDDLHEAASEDVTSS